jgi:hypothetical protein
MVLACLGKWYPNGFCVVSMKLVGRGWLFDRITHILPIPVRLLTSQWIFTVLLLSTGKPIVYSKVKG